MSLRKAAQKAWKSAKSLEMNTLGNLQAQSTNMRRAIYNNRARVGFVLRLMNWKQRTDTRGVAARFLLATMPKMLAPTFSMKMKSREDRQRVAQEVINWSKYDRTSGREMKSRWKQVVRYLSQSKSSSNNQVQIYSNGSPAMKAMWEAIGSAKHRVWMTTYILKPDMVGLRTIEELTNAALRGVQVIFIHDHLGSIGFPDVYFEDLRAAGGTVLCFNSITSTARFFRFDWRTNYVLYRNHRKILVVDNDVGFCGGMNIAADYCGEEVGGNGRFRDTHARIVGPAVVDLAGVFMSTIQTMQSQNIEGWAEIFKDSLKMAEDLPPPVNSATPSSKRAALNVASGSAGQIQPIVQQIAKASKQTMGLFPEPINGSFLQVLSSNSRENRRTIQKALSDTIDLAQKHVYLTSPYFLPPLSIRQAIIRAANRGVDVRILTAGKSDIYLITSASAHIYGIFLRHGVRVYELQSQELHAKTVTSDGAVAMVGSYNLDNLSYKHNLEANLNLVDSNLALQIERQFFEDLKYSKEIIKERWENRFWITRVWNWFVYHLFSLILR